MFKLNALSFRIAKPFVVEPTSPQKGSEADMIQCTSCFDNSDVWLLKACKAGTHMRGRQPS